MIQKNYRRFNTTFVLTLGSDICVERFEKNLSDVSAVLKPLHADSPNFWVPEPTISGKVQFLTGYSLKEVQAKDSATVLTNMSLLKPQVYLWSLLCIIIFILFIKVRTALRLRPSTRRKYLPFFVRREISAMFYRTSEHFKLITHLYSILFFFITTVFMCLYKTSHVIVKEPFYPTNYEESLNHPTSTAFFYDQFCVSSSSFRDAPPGSVKHALWNKLLASGKKEEFRFDDMADKPGRLGQLISLVPVEMMQLKSIAVATSMVIKILQTLVCGVSPEGDLWWTTVLSDPSESETIYGFAAAHHAPFIDFFRKMQRRYFESHVMARHYHRSFDITEPANQLSPASKQHKQEQHMVCFDPDALNSNHYVRSIPLSYFYSFLMGHLAVWIIAVIINFIQIRRKNREKRRAQDERRMRLHVSENRHTTHFR